MKNFLLSEIFLKKLAIYSQLRLHKGMRKKSFYIACFLCTGALAVPSVFGKGPTYKELWEIAKEACTKNLWKPEVKNPNATEGLCYDRDINAWRCLSRNILCYSKIDNTSKIFRQQLSNLIKKCEKDVLPEWNTEEWDFGTEAILHNTIKNARETESILKVFTTSNLEQLVPFLMGKMQPFAEKRDLEFLKAIDAFAKELRAFYEHLRVIQSETAKTEISPEMLEKLSKTFTERQSALLETFQAPMSDKNSLKTYFRADFLEVMNGCAFVKKFNALRREASFNGFKPKDFKTEEEKAEENFGILGLDMNLVKYTNPFKNRSRKDQVGAFLKQIVRCFEKEIRSACKHIGTTAEGNLIDALEYLYSLTKNVWNREQPFEPESVTLPFKKAMLACDIEGLISEYKPKRETNTLHEGLLLLKNDKGIDTDAVEKSIYDAYVSRFEENVKKHYYAEVTALWNLTNHRISFIKTVREMEASNYKDPEAAQQNAAKQVTEWRLKQEEYVQEFRAADVNFYGAFFGVEKKEHDGKYIPTAIGAVKQPGCMDVLENLLKDYCLWESIVWKKKKEIPQNPNDKEQNTIVEDKKELVEDKKETGNVIIAPEYTKLTNEKEPAKRKRRTAKNDE